MKKALIVGINEYPNETWKLSGCVDDAKSVSKLLKYNDDGNLNFNVLELINHEATRANVKKNIIKAFSNTDIGLFYFSGHGFDDRNDGQIVLYDGRDDLLGMTFKEIVECASQGDAPNKIIILDCCFSGRAGSNRDIGDKTTIDEGVTILTACTSKESALEVNGRGVFTNLLLSALEGGAADILGNVTPGSVYAYIDRSLGAFEQRPVFKTNVSRFVSLRNCTPKIQPDELRKIKIFFANPNDEYQLDPSYEPKNYEGSKECPAKEPYCTKEHAEIMTLLQEMNRNGLVVPTIDKHMYFAAMNGHTCKLTALGKHYWLLATKGNI